jgi:hypothetical protein
MPNLSCEDVVQLGLARVQEYTRSHPAVRSVLYRRISTRQQELAAMAARVNRDYFGAAADAVLVGGAADLNDIVTPVPTPEMIQRIEVSTVVAGAVPAVGDEISIVRLSDPTAELAPRVTLRSGVLRAVGADLNNVTGIKVYFSKLPDALLVTEPGTTLVALPAPYDQLLVLDISSLIVERTQHGDPLDPIRQSVAEGLKKEIAEWEAKWIAHVRGLGEVRSRFTS